MKKVFFFLINYFWRTSILIVGPVIPLFWWCLPGFQTQGGSLNCMLPRLRAMDWNNIIYVIAKSRWISCPMTLHLSLLQIPIHVPISLSQRFLSFQFRRLSSATIALDIRSGLSRKVSTGLFRRTNRWLWVCSQELIGDYRSIHTTERWVWVCSQELIAAYGSVHTTERWVWVCSQ